MPVITHDQWSLIEPFRKSVEKEFTNNVIGKPERLGAFDETVEVLREGLGDYGLDLTNPDTVFAVAASMVSTLSFVNSYFQTVCPDPHPLGHLSVAAVFMGYLVRSICFTEGIPAVTA